MTRAASMLEAERITVSLPDRSRKPLWGSAPLTTILREVSLQIAPGETIGVVGESDASAPALHGFHAIDINAVRWARVFGCADEQSQAGKVA